MNLRPLDLHLAQLNARAEHAQDADVHAQRFNACVGSLSRSFVAMNHHPVCLRLQGRQAPVIGADLHAAAGHILELRGQPTPHQPLELRRACPERQHNYNPGQDYGHARGVPKQPVAARRPPLGRRGAHCSPPFRAGGFSATGARSSISTSPCLRRLSSHAPKSWFTCCCRRISSMRGDTDASGGAC